MFSVGDKVIYGSMGVCTVVDIAVPDLPGAHQTCYVLEPRYVANSKVYAPVGQSAVCMRVLLTPEEAQSLIDSLPGIGAFPAGGERQALYNTCRSAIKSADSHLLAKLIKTLYEKKERAAGQRKLLPSTEKAYFDTAEKMLYGELAVVLGIPMDEVGGYIEERLGRPAAQAAVS